jgi:hypothetical protein
LIPRRPGGRFSVVSFRSIRRSYRDDPMPQQFDIQKTAVVDSLLKIPRDQRDANWTNHFFAALPDASLAASEQQVFRGPDGMQYFDLHLPEQGKPFEAHCMSALAEHCTNNGLGVVLNPQSDPPDWVFSYGDLWSLRTHGRLMLRQQDGAVGGEGDQVLVAAPSEQLLPAWARNVLKSFLKWAGVETPKVALVVSQKSRPAEMLLFNVHAEDFPQEKFEMLQRLLAWFIPPHLSVVYVPKGSDFEKHLIDL